MRSFLIQLCLQSATHHPDLSVFSAQSVLSVYLFFSNRVRGAVRHLSKSLSGLRFNIIHYHSKIIKACNTYSVSHYSLSNYSLLTKKAWLLHTSLFSNNKIFSYFFIVKQLKMRNFARIYPYTVHYSDYNYIK